MNPRPITPKAHGLIDYGFTAVQLLAPALLGVNHKAANLYRVLGLNLLSYNAITKHQAAVKPFISYNAHHQIDRGNVGFIALLAALPFVRKDKKALAFHAAFLGLALLNVVLTDWNDGKNPE
jgi:hypothetical protein